MRRVNHFLLLLLATLPTAYQLLLYGLPATDDGLTHLWRVARLHDSLRAGVLFPRWVPEMLLGLGYPLLNYYASSTYYLAELFHLIGFNLPHAIIAVNCLLIAIAALGMYCLARDTLPQAQPWAATVAATAYAYAPYMMINLYVRGAIAEVGAQALLPWIFWGFQRIWRAPNPTRYVGIATLSLGALAFTHTISLLILPLLLILYNAALALSASERNLRLRYAVLAMIGAAGMSCFFWAPLLFERDFVAERGFNIAKSFMLPENFQNWATLVDPHFLFDYAHGLPWQMGLLQTSLAVLGLVLLIWQIGRLSAKAEWGFWIGVSLLSLLLMVEVSKPFWFSNDIMPIVQFPWRFLAILQLPLALFTALLVTFIRPRLLQALATLALLTLLIVVHLPRITPEYIFEPSTSQFNVAAHAYYDPIRGDVAQSTATNTGLQEFQPRWASELMLLDTTTVTATAPSLPAADRKITLLAANDTQLQLAIEASEPSQLRFTTYFFPGWTVLLDGQTRLETYPTTNLGLLTIDLPAGSHTLDVAWRGTSVQFGAGLISQLVLAGLALMLLWWRNQRAWLWLLLPLLGIGLIATYTQPRLLPVQPLNFAATPPALDFLGMTAPNVEEQGIYLTTYWLAKRTQPTAIQTRWQLLDENGEIVQEITAIPFYNRYSTDNWPANTLVDDHQWLPLPPGLAAGDYQLQMTILNAETGESYASLAAGMVDLPQATPALHPTSPLEVQVGDNVWLKGYDFYVVEPSLQAQKPLPTRPEMPILDAGQTMAYTLYWQAEQATDAPYAGFIHLVDSQGIPYAQQDQYPGPVLQPSGLWTPYGVYRDRYLLRLDSDMPSGLYMANVGMYDWRVKERFDVTIPGIEGVSDHYELPPIKVVNQSVQPSGTKVEARFDQFAHLLRFQVESGQAGLQEVNAGGEFAVRPGDVLTLTTYYEVNAPSSVPLTRYLQIRDAQNQILTQYDSEPQQGGNPTWAWVPGEIVADEIPLTLPVDIPDNGYTLYLGWYDAAANFAHTPLFDAQGNRLTNDEVPLFHLTVTP